MSVIVAIRRWSGCRETRGSAESSPLPCYSPMRSSQGLDSEQRFSGPRFDSRVIASTFSAGYRGALAGMA
jgi:hypothetical protein